MKYLLLLSTYNNEKNFLENYEKIIAKDLKIDILVVDRGSTDRTRHFLRNNNVPRLELGVHATYYNAISLGLAYAHENKYDGVIEFDINGRFKIEDIFYLIATYENKKTDLVMASRYLDRDVKLKKRNKLICFTSKLVLRKNVTDPTTRFKLFGKKAINFFGKKNKLFVPSPDRIIQLLRAGYTFFEVQIKMNTNFRKQNPHKWNIALAETTSWIISILFAHPFRKELK